MAADNQQQNQTEYEPSAAEKKLLQVLLNPDCIGLHVTEICQMADISRDVYYRAFKKPEFEALVKQESVGLVTKSVMPIVNTFIKEAQKGSYQHGKAILEMAGVYAEKQKQEVTGSLTIKWADDEK